MQGNLTFNMLYKQSRVQMRNKQSDGIFNGKTGHVEKVEIVMGLPYFVIKWDKEKKKNPTLYEMKDLKDLTLIRNGINMRRTMERFSSNVNMKWEVLRKIQWLKVDSERNKLTELLLEMGCLLS
jgi:hypothetical protein